MSKLDGNERWRGKMLLTEHQQQYDERNIVVVKQQTPEERLIIRDYLVLPHMPTMVNNSLQDNELSRNPLKGVLSLFLQVLMSQISRRMQMTVKEFGNRNIRVIKDEQVDDIYYYQVKCRGFTERVGYTREVMRTEIRLQITKFTEEILYSMSRHANFISID